MSNLTFRQLVTVSVILIGSGFGSWAGICYTGTYFWIASILGAVGGIFAAKLYLFVLDKATRKQCNTSKIWLNGCITAACCGLVCTILIHTVMLVPFVVLYKGRLVTTELGPDFVGIFLVGCLVVGTVAGLVAGAICSSVYVCKVVKNEQ